MPRSDGYKNLKPMNKRTKADVKKITSKGGKKSGEVRAERKKLKDELIMLLATDDNQYKMSSTLVKQAIKGNLSAFLTIRDTIGEKPVDKVENTNVDMTLEEYLKKVEDKDEY